MKIDEAVKLAISENKCIMRSNGYAEVIIKPTNSKECCVGYVCGKSYPLWNPTADDLIADDWKVIELNFLFP